MNRALASACLIVCCLSAPAFGKGTGAYRTVSGPSGSKVFITRPMPDIELPAPEERSGRPAGVSALSSALYGDTVRYGGTRWAPDSLRWEALRDSAWTFDTGVGSALGATGPNKPAGYHTMMEGWYGIDQTLNPLPWFRRSTTCAIDGLYSFWAGITLEESYPLCWVAGQGYGNSWVLTLTKSFSYPGTGNVTLSYSYAVEAEPGFDYTYVVIDTTGTNPGWDTYGDVWLKVYSGTVSGLETITLQRGVDLPSSARTVTIKFEVNSDGSYSDEDGQYATTCGHTAIDDIRLTGAITDFSDFETGADGWALAQPTTGIGDYSNIVNSRTDLPPPTAFCPCAFRDSVLVFYDLTAKHPFDQDNVVASPWIDLRRGGDAGRPGKLMMYDIYAQMPLADMVYVQIRARWYPAVCPNTGRLYTTPWRDQNIIFYYGEGPFCTRPGSVRLRDYSGVIDAGAEQVQIAYGVLHFSMCEWSCSYTSNSTPWIDNISLGIYGSPVAPTTSLTTLDILQDAFAQDGTLNPAATGRLDTAALKTTGIPKGQTVLRDTLVARGDGGNTEVRLVFEVRPGPFTNGASLAARAARWTAEPSIPAAPGAVGGTWYSARMDTAEQGGVKSAGAWMACFHESDPGFLGTDRTPDPLDPSQLENEILPDHILTPGSRVDYFVTSRYLPGDPRNPGGMNWWVSPDTTGGRFREVEILPSSMSADSSWNCVLYVDHHEDREFEEQQLEEQGLTYALGAGGTTPEGTRFDRWDLQTPSSDYLSFGRPAGGNYGASLEQALGYGTIVWHSSTLASLQFADEDAQVLAPWLAMRTGGGRFWGSGDGLVTSMDASGKPAVVAFQRNTLGVLRTCNTIRDVGCPGGAPLDSTFCLPTSGAAGAEFATTLPINVRGNGCAMVRSFDLIRPNPAVASARGQLNYVKSGIDQGYASVTNRPAGPDSRTIVDGFAFGQVRSRPVSPNIPALCVNTAAALQRSADIFGWFGAATSACRTPYAVTGVPETAPARPRSALGLAHPNPMSQETRIAFTNGLDGGRVTIRLFDVTGRLVRTLLDGRLPEGPHEIVWDGRLDGGTPAARGLYFYTMTVGGTKTVSRKIVVVR